VDVCFLARVFIVYDTKYGNTKLVAEKIAEAMKQTKEIETTVADIEVANLKNIDTFDVILIGTPNHMGRPSRTITNFIDELGKLKLKPKKAAVFDTHMAEDYRAVEKMEKRIHEKAPALKLITPGLNIRVDGMSGPIMEDELQKATEFGRKVAAQLKT
jgi:flavodoxin